MESELSLSITTIQSKVSSLKYTVGERETSLSVCTDCVAGLQAKVEHKSAELARLDNKCEDLVCFGFLIIYLIFINIYLFYFVWILYFIISVLSN